MKPVKNISSGALLRDHKDAKPYLIDAMGEYCVYCERHVEAINLDVEHLKPQKSHSRLALVWSNFLLACKSCNTYKRHYQAAHRQVGILKKQAWPHLDNTYFACSYDQSGRVTPSNNLSNTVHHDMILRTLEMTGLDKTPATAASYQALGLVYDITSRREKAWKKAKIALCAYEQNPTDVQKQTILNQAEEVGFFSIWMFIFGKYPVIKKALIATFKADTACFDQHGNAIIPRQAGRI